MRAVILAGGLGTRLMEMTSSVPKPMVTVGHHPLLWHLMHIYSSQGINDFVIAAGYKSHVIKEWVVSLVKQQQTLTASLQDGTFRYESSEASSASAWNIVVLETGLETKTSGRLTRVMREFPGETLALTYGDGLANVALAEQHRFHKSHGRLATVTAVRPPARFGSLELEGDVVSAFGEKLRNSEGWINGGFFILEPGVRQYLDEYGGDDVPLEGEPLTQLARDHELMAYRHEDFWHPMDTLRDRQVLEEMWASGDAPWRARRSDRGR